MVIDFSSFYDLPREMNRLLDQAANPLAISQRRVAYPLLNISEDDAAFYVDVDLPGVDPAEVDIQLTGRSLTIKGERTPVKGTYYRQERLMGNFQRILKLGARVDRDAVKATFDDGILRIVLPKADAAKPKKITIEA